MCRPSLLLSAPARPFSLPAAIMLALISRLLDWFRSLFWKEEMELTLVGLQYSGKTTFVNVIAVSAAGSPAPGAAARESGPVLARSPWPGLPSARWGEWDEGWRQQGVPVSSAGAGVWSSRVLAPEA